MAPLASMRASARFAESMPETVMDAWRRARGGWRLAGAVVVLGLSAAIAAIVAMSGGPPNPFVHLLYLPILLAGVLFKTVGGAIAGLVAGLMVGPIMPGGQPAADWIVRAVFMTTVGGLFGQSQALIERRLSQGRELAQKISTIQARTLSTFAQTVDLRDKPTGGHSQRVAHNARAVAIALGLGPDALRAVYWSGLLHDLGKIAIPERILQKPSKLTEDEFVTIRRHSDIGANLLMSVSGDLKPISEGVRTHHERWDGTGYPRGLRGDDIPLVGRIVSVVDVFEALTCTRPYRSPRPVAEVLEFIRARAGTAFDPALVPLLEDLYWNGEIYTAAAAESQLPVEEPPVVIPAEGEDSGTTSLLRVIAGRDFHSGAKARP